MTLNNAVFVEKKHV